MNNMLDNKHTPYELNENNSSARFFLLRMLFKHIELFSLWKKSSSIKPESSLYAITIELLDEMQRLDASAKSKSYKKVAGKFLISISDLAKTITFTKSLPQFYFYLYLMHRKLHASLAANNNSPIRHSQAIYLHFITNEIIDEVCSLDKGIKASMYKREIARLKESFAEHT